MTTHDILSDPAAIASIIHDRLRGPAATAFNGGTPRTASLERLDDDLVPNGPRYADAAWSVPYEHDDRRSATHMVLLLKRAPDPDDDIQDRMRRHAESLSRAFDRLRICGHPDAPADFFPIVLDERPAVPDPDEGPHPLAATLRLPGVVADLLCNFVLGSRDPLLAAPCASSLDLDRLSIVPDVWIDPADRYAHVAWSAPFHPDADAPNGATHAIFLIRCESLVRHDADVRLEANRQALAAAFDQRRAYGHPDRPALVVPVLVYTGDTPWTAPNAVTPVPPRP